MRGRKKGKGRRKKNRKERGAGRGLTGGRSSVRTSPYPGEAVWQEPGRLGEKETFLCIVMVA